LSELEKIVNRLVKQGDRIPSVRLARCRENDIESVSLDAELAGRRVAIVGVVGAFTPVCTEDHIPEFVSGAAAITGLGYDRIICVAPNDPWTVKAWADKVDPERRIIFLSDGNLELARRLGVAVQAEKFYLGERPRRYLLITVDGNVERLTVETNSLAVTCTGATELRAAA
jgi:peroxiredoxin